MGKRNRLLLLLGFGFALLLVALPHQDSKISFTNIHYPMVQLGNVESGKIAFFIWSANCAKCQKTFEKEMWDIFLRARDKKDIGLVLIQYEDSTTPAYKEMMNALCLGLPIYNSYVIGQLVVNFTLEQTMKSPVTKKTPRDVCSDPKTAEREAEDFLNFIRTKYNPQAGELPIMGLNEIAVSNSKALREKLR